MKKILITLTLAVALLATCLTSCATEPTDIGEEAAAVFTVDVNPGVRVYVKADNTVLAVEATNEDGETIVEELDVEGDTVDAAVEEIVTEMEEQGYIEGEDNSVLVSVEKKDGEITDKIGEKLGKAFEKRGKKAHLIEQELEELDDEMEETIDEVARKHKISKGKAHLIEKIREELPELSEEELANLKVSDLGMILEDTSDDVKNHFKKIDKPVEGDYIGKDAALAKALESVDLTEDAVKMLHVHVTREDGKMVYEVEFINETTEYEILVDAVSGEIVETDTEEVEEFDPKEALDKFYNKHDLDKDSVKDHFRPDDKTDDEKEQDDTAVEAKPISKGDAIKAVIEAFAIDRDSIRKTDVRLHEDENGVVYSVIIKVGEDVYKTVVEAFSGTIIDAALNGEAVELDAPVDSIVTEEPTVEATPEADLAA